MNKGTLAEYIMEQTVIFTLFTIILLLAYVNRQE